MGHFSVYLGKDNCYLKPCLSLRSSLTWAHEKSSQREENRKVFKELAWGENKQLAKPKRERKKERERERENPRERKRKEHEKMGSMSYYPHEGCKTRQAKPFVRIKAHASCQCFSIINPTHISTPIYIYILFFFPLSFPYRLRKSITNSRPLDLPLVFMARR